MMYGMFHRYTHPICTKENEFEAPKHPGTAGSIPRIHFLPGDASSTEKEHQGTYIDTRTLFWLVCHSIHLINSPNSPITLCRTSLVHVLCCLLKQSFTCYVESARLVPVHMNNSYNKWSSDQISCRCNPIMDLTCALTCTGHDIHPQ